MRASVRWLVFSLWVLVVFAAVPYANEIQASISGRFGVRSLRYALTAVLAGSIAGAVVALGRRGSFAPRRLAWVLAVAGLALAVMWRLPVEAEPAHLAAYGILGGLAFWALAAHLRDAGVYLAAAALTAIFGILDEVFQWLLPGRYWELGDAGLNAAAGALAQAAIWQGVRPPGIAAGVGARSLRIAARLAAGAVALLVLCLANTPERTEWLASQVPGLSYLGERRSTRMTEYGHLYRDPEIGLFRSRLAPSELRDADRRLGAEAGRALDRLGRPGSYGRFQRDFRPGRAPFVFEAGGHLFYRERLRQRADQEDDPGERRRLATVAWRENLILERYFPRTLAGSSAALEPAERRRLKALHLPEAEFESEVSDWLLTAFTEAQARWALLALLAVLVAVDRISSRRLDASGSSAAGAVSRCGRRAGRHGTGSRAG